MRKQKYKYNYHEDRKYYITAAAVLSILTIVLIGVFCWPAFVALVPAAAAVAIASATGMTAAVAATTLAASVFAVAGLAIVTGLSVLTAKLCDWFIHKPSKHKYVHPEKTTHALLKKSLIDKGKTKEITDPLLKEDSEDLPRMQRGFNGMGLVAEAPVVEEEKPKKKRGMKK